MCNTLRKFLDVFDAHAPKKTKVLRVNQKPHVDKNLRKAIIKRSKLKSKANRTKLQDHIANIRNNEIWWLSLIEIQNFVISIT